MTFPLPDEQLNARVLLQLKRLAVALGVSALAACGGSDAPSGASTGTEPATDATPPADTGTVPPVVVTDPLFQYQWHLVNTGQVGDPNTGLRGTPGVDINVAPAWKRGLDGRGVTIGVVDDGLEMAHEDLRANVDSEHSVNYLKGDRDPTPDDASDSHGTAVAGVIAAARNSAGGVGVAPAAKLAGFNVLATQLSSDIYDALARGAKDGSVAVSNNSWGHEEVGMPYYPDFLVEEILRDGVDRGRQSKGTVYVFAAGNGNYESGFNLSNFESLHTPETLLVCALNAKGTAARYSVPGSNLLVCAPSDDMASGDGVAPDTPGITTTEPFSSYTHAFGGTSSAAPTVSGVVALMLQANPRLTWRDVRLILARTARILPAMANDPAAQWITTAATNPYTGKPYRYSPRYGFGLVDADAATAYAARFASVGRSSRAWREAACTAAISGNGTATTGITRNLSMSCGARRIEFLKADLELEHPYFRALRITLISPGGTPIMLSREHPICDPSAFADAYCRSTERFHNRYVTNALTPLDEPASGTWTLRIEDALGTGAPLAFKNFTLTLN